MHAHTGRQKVAHEYFFFTFGTANLHKPVWHNSEMCFGGTLIKLTWQKSDLILKNSAAEYQ